MKENFGLYVDNRIQECIRYIFCTSSKNGKCVDISTIKTSSLYECEKCKTSRHVLNIAFQEQKLKVAMIGGDGHFAS